MARVRASSSIDVSQELISVSPAACFRAHNSRRPTPYKIAPILYLRMQNILLLYYDCIVTGIFLESAASKLN